MRRTMSHFFGALTRRRKIFGSIAGCLQKNLDIKKNFSAESPRHSIFLRHATRIGNPTTPRFRNLHLCAIWLHPFYPTPPTHHPPPPPPPSVLSFRLQSLPYRSKVVFLPLPPQD